MTKKTTKSAVVPKEEPKKVKVKVKAKVSKPKPKTRFDLILENIVSISKKREQNETLWGILNDCYYKLKHTQ